MTCQAVPIVSYEYHGPSPATHSPYPTMPSPRTVTMMHGRSISVPKLVVKGATSGKRIWRRSTASILMDNSHHLQRRKVHSPSIVLVVREQCGGVYSRAKG